VNAQSEHAATAADLVERYREGSMSDDTALTEMVRVTGLDEGDAAFLLIDRWDALHRAERRAALAARRNDDGTWR
jgi:hypothetical protein